MTYWFSALALMLVIEGLMPFLFPKLWRVSFVRLVALNDGQLRFIGVSAILSGLLMLYWIN